MSISITTEPQFTFHSRLSQELSDKNKYCEEKSVVQNIFHNNTNNGNPWIHFIEENNNRVDIFIYDEISKKTIQMVQNMT